MLIYILSYKHFIPNYTSIFLPTCTMNRSQNKELSVTCYFISFFIRFNKLQSNPLLTTTCRLHWVWTIQSLVFIIILSANNSWHIVYVINKSNMHSWSTCLHLQRLFHSVLFTQRDSTKTLQKLPYSHNKYTGWMTLDNFINILWN